MNTILCLPTEILKMILINLDLVNFSRCVQVCRRFKNIGEDPFLRGRFTDEVLLIDKLSMIEKLRNSWCFPLLKRVVITGCRLEETDLRLLEMCQEKQVVMVACHLANISPKGFAR